MHFFQNKLRKIYDEVKNYYIYYCLFYSLLYIFVRYY